MKEKFLGIFGHFNIDITLRVPFLPTKGSVNVLSEKEIFGGTAGNFSIVASRLGIPFVPLSAVSIKSHANYLEYLANRGVDTSDIVVESDGYGPVCYSVTDGNEQIYYLNQGPMNSPFTHKLKEDWNSFKYIHFGTGPPEDYLNVLRRSSGSIKVFDPGQEVAYRYSKEVLSQFLELSDLVLVNAFEKERMMAILNVNERELFLYGKEYIITKGERGVEFFSDGNLQNIDARRVKEPFDTIGAGDAFRAGFYLGIYSGKKFDESIAIGNIVASEAIRKPLTEFNLTKNDVLEIFDTEAGKMIH